MGSSIQDDIQVRIQGVSRSYREGDQLHSVLKNLDAEFNRGEAVSALSAPLSVELSSAELTFAIKASMFLFGDHSWLDISVLLSDTFSASPPAMDSR